MRFPPSDDDINEFRGASRTGDGNVISDFLYTFDADFHGKSEILEKSLRDAAFHGYPGIVSMILKSGADINAGDDYGATALIMASRKGLKHIVELLLQNGADAHLQDYNRVTALMTARAYSHHDVIKLIEDWPETQKQRTENEQKKREQEKRAQSDARLDRLKQSGPPKLTLKRKP